MRKIPWLAKALSSASASSADWLGSNGAAHEAHVEGKANKVVDLDLQYCNSVLHFVSTHYSVLLQGLIKILRKENPKIR